MKIHRIIALLFIVIFSYFLFIPWKPYQFAYEDLNFSPTCQASSQFRNCDEMELLGTYPEEGWFQDVYIHENYAYTAASPGGFGIFDVTNPQEPVLVNQPQEVSDAKKVFVQDSYAFIASKSVNLEIFDINDPNNPQKVGEYKTQINDVFISGSYAYIGSHTALKIIDISDPTNPLLVGRLDQSTHCVFVQGKYAYIGTGGGLVIIDISDPTNPLLLGRLDQSTHCVFVSGSYAYIGGDKFRVIYISDPMNPTQIGVLDSETSISGLFVSEPYAYVTVGFGLGVIDISNPSDPRYINFNNMGPNMGFYTTAKGVFVSRSYAYVAAGLNGLKIVNVTNPSNAIEIVGQVKGGSSAQDVFVQDPYAYIADGDNGLEIIDITNPSTPIKVGQYYDGGYSLKVFVKDPYVYMLEQCGLEIIDITNRRNPIKVGYLSNSEGVYYNSRSNIILNGSYAYIAHEGLEIVDISEPNSPFRISSSFLDIFPIRDVVFQNSFAFASAGFQGLVILNISNPTNITSIGKFKTEDPSIMANEVCISDSYAYISYSWLREADYAEIAGKIVILDISDPKEPIQIGESETIETIYDIFINGSYLYVVTDPEVISFNISDPTNPTKFNYFWTGSLMEAVFVSGPSVFVAVGLDGLIILRPSYETDCTTTGSLATTGSLGVFGVIMIVGSALLTVIILKSSRKKK
ncbi:MAG: LVIVD repeat-containing protein [Promethearchaeota archaeon]